MYEWKERFLEKVDKREPDECWKWKASIHHSGYGQFHRNGKVLAPHRVMWELITGPIPDGLCVCHTCDNRSCCNPSHLWLGTVADNNRDRDAKGRNPPHLSKLTWKEVRKIRRLYAIGGYTYEALGKKFGVSMSHIGKIVRYIHWRD